ncbi:FadR/GntR family transcriptional regulator [Pseudodesulfovibrio sp.]|uniref:FadR/GntR family transcriptional regulator n=1 Tax=unclassified Pseudodesulfovibrio TaxID=2661612 RepID=UPI003AFF61CD
MSGSNTISHSLGQRPSLPEELAGVIAKQIEVGDFKPGDVLPSETHMAKSFNVSRTVVREALARLKYEGIIQSKRGSGPVVCQEGNRKIFTLPAEFASAENKANILEFRLVVEGESAALAAMRRSEEQLQKMERCLKDMERALAEKVSGLMPDYGFHAMIAEAAGNEYIVNFLRFLSSKLLMGVQQARSLSNQNMERAEEVFKEHSEIYEAIEKQCPCGARKAVHQHLLNSALRQGIKLDYVLCEPQ